MKNRTPFPSVFWIANTIEVLERFAYYGIYLGFGIYMEYLGFSKGQLGIVQSLFLLQTNMDSKKFLLFPTWHTFLLFFC
jgi:dipeptide/tripeptide permease